MSEKQLRRVPSLKLPIISLNAACSWMQARILDFAKDRAGHSSMEYALLTALVSMVVVVSLDTMGSTISDWFFSVSGSITSATPTG